MKAFRPLIGALAVAGLAFVTFGCENTGRAREDAAATAEKAGDKATEAAKDAGAAIDTAKQFVDVKAALMADSSVDASHIDVDTNVETKTIMLRGSVPTAAQKEAAERIARDKAEGYTIVNQLKVGS